MAPASLDCLPPRVSLPAERFLLHAPPHGQRLHHNGYEYFVSTDEPRPQDEALLRLSPVLAWTSDGLNLPLDAGRPNTPQQDELPRGAAQMGRTRGPLPMVRWSALGGGRRCGGG